MNIKNKINQLTLQEKVSRNEIQDLCLELQSEQFVLLNFCTRLGKTKSGLNCATGKTLVLTPTHFIGDDWRSQCSHKVICYHSLHKELNVYDTIICDEAHHLTPRLLTLLNNFLKDKPDLRVIWLTGTITYQNKVAWKLMTKGKGFEWQIELEQAIKWGIIPAPEIICFGLTLKDDKRYLLYERGKNKTKSNKVVQYKSQEFWSNVKNKSVNLLVQCTEKEWFELVDKDQVYWLELAAKKKQEQEQLKQAREQAREEGRELTEEEVDRIIVTTTPDKVIENNINKIGSKRKKMFSQLKNRFIRKITNHFGLEHKRVIYFCNDIPQAEFLDPRYAVHSKNKDGKQLVEDFNEGVRNKLVSVNQLNEGVNLTKVDAAIIIQASASKVRSTQQAARPLISELPLIIIMYYKGTRDQEYVEKFVSQFNSDYIKWISP